MTDDLPADASTEPAETSEMAEAAESAKKAKSERTRALILETAMRLFQERGYDKTTMRAIAAEAGVSVGNAYYYYEGKEFRRESSKDRDGSSFAGTVGERG
ncbi:AcrR family transcriptional regulator [Streptacidiphilus sp. MAP12-20]